MNSSLLLRRATVNSQRFITCWPPVSRMAISPTALSSASSSSMPRSSSLAASAGISTSKGTTAKSWNSSTPITRLPYSVSSSSRSAISLTTMAVLLMASTPDSATAPCQEKCQTLGMTQRMPRMMSVLSIIVASTCSSPRPNTWRFMVRSLGRLNSSPMTNIRNTTPNSARCWMRSLRCTMPSMCGPITAPTAR